MSELTPLSIKPILDTLPENGLNEQSLSSLDINPLKLYEYVVTLKSKEDLQDFYNDMETPGGDLYIPDRAVELTHRKPISRNTHYRLTAVEAKLISEDKRVESVELALSERPDVKMVPHTQYSDRWDKSSNLNTGDKNWGLLRCYTGEENLNWGSDATETISGTINITNAGKNVDVVILDGHIPPSHPEYAVNPDGTGGTRVIQYDWFQHNAEVGTTLFGDTYLYDAILGQTANNEHGTHVAGTACGNTQGWAREANIYNLNAYGAGSTTMQTYSSYWSSYMIDYIRAFHNNKSINPETGRKNPTIVNMSIGLQTVQDISVDNYSHWRWGGVIRSNAPGSFGLIPDGFWAYMFGIAGTINGTEVAYWNTRSASIDADITDAIDDGIIFVGSAGNYKMWAARDSSSSLWDDAMLDFDSTDSSFQNPLKESYVHRGSSPSAAEGVICVGGIGTTARDARDNGYSNYGDRVDVYAPGTSIMSSVFYGQYVAVNDPRNIYNEYTSSVYKIGKTGGTSMSSPQVAGVLACALSTYPEMNQQDAYNYLIEYCTNGQIRDSDDIDFISTYNTIGIGGQAGEGNNRYLKYRKERADIGQVTPKRDYFIRPSSGRIYPRTRIKRRG